MSHAAHQESGITDSKNRLFPYILHRPMVTASCSPVFSWLPPPSGYIPENPVDFLIPDIQTMVQRFCICHHADPVFSPHAEIASTLIADILILFHFRLVHFSLTCGADHCTSRYFLLICCRWWCHNFRLHFLFAVSYCIFSFRFYGYQLSSSQNCWHNISFLLQLLCNAFLFCYSTAKVSSAMHAISSPTFAVAFPTPIGPFTFIISVSSVRISPGTTFLLNFAELMDAK